MNSMPRIFDGHLDLAMNAVAYDRDQTLPVPIIRKQERAAAGVQRGPATVSVPELRDAAVGVFIGTLFTRAKPGAVLADCLLRTDCDSMTPAAAHARAVAQLAYYRLLERQRQLAVITDADSLPTHWQAVRAGGTPTVGCLLLIECADCITAPGEVEWWRQQGVRAVGLAHYGQSIYADGTGGATGLTPLGLELLSAMHECGMALDLSHSSDRTFYQSMEAFGGDVLASHTNCRRLCTGDRQFTDEQLRLIHERRGVVGVVMHNGMLKNGWDEKLSPRSEVTLETVVEHIDHMCQLFGDAEHTALGSDLDGGFGTEACPAGLDTIADLQKLAPLLSARGYGDADIDAIFHGNWLRFWTHHLNQAHASSKADQGNRI